MAEAPRDRRKAWIRVALTVLLLGGGVGAISALHEMGWGTFARALASVSLLPLALALVVSTVQVFAQLARFVVLIPREARGTFLDLLDATAIGQLLNYATPLRSGDAYKLVRLAPSGAKGGGRFASLLAAIVVERVADVGVLFLFAAWAAGPELVALVASHVPAGGTALAIGGAVAIASALALVFARRLPRMLGSFLGNAWGLLRSQRFAASIGVSVVTWALDAGTLYWTARSGGFAISFRDATQCVFVLNLGIAMPVTVGNIGIFEATLGFALSRHGIGPELALAIATVEHFAKMAGLGITVGLLRLARLLPGLARADPPPA